MTLLLAILAAAFTPLTEDETKIVLQQLEAVQSAAAQSKQELAQAAGANGELRQANAASLDKIRETGLALGAANAATITVQQELDAKNDRIAKLEAKVEAEASAKWFWFWSWLGTVALVAGFFIARQYLPFLKVL